MSKRRHNFGTKRFKKILFYISCPYRGEVADTAVCTPDCARCQNRENTHTDTQTHRHTDRTSTVTLAHARGWLTSTVTLAHARRWLTSTITLAHARRGLIIIIINSTCHCQCTISAVSVTKCGYKMNFSYTYYTGA